MFVLDSSFVWLVCCHTLNIRWSVTVHTLPADHGDAAPLDCSLTLWTAGSRRHVITASCVGRRAATSYFSFQVPCIMMPLNVIVPSRSRIAVSRFSFGVCVSLRAWCMTTLPPPYHKNFGRFLVGGLPQLSIRHAEWIMGCELLDTCRGLVPCNS